MHLQDHPALHLRFLHPAGDVDHRFFDDVGGGALYRGVDGEALAQAAGLAVAAGEFDDLATTAEEGGDITLLRGGPQHLVDEALDAVIALKVAVDVALRLELGDAEVGRKPERADPVDDAEIHRLRDPAHLGSNRVFGKVEELDRRAGVDIFAGAERFDQHRVLRHVGQDAQLNLIVIGGEKLISRLGDKRLTDAAAELSLDRNILKVRLFGGEAAGGGDRLIELGVDPAGLGMNQLGKGVDIG